MTRTSLLRALGVCGLVLAIGCSQRERDDASMSGSSGAGAGGSNPFDNPGNAGTGGSGFVPGPPLGDPSLDTGGCGHLEVRNLDLLFMVDDSGSMMQEQEALRREFPRMVEQLTTGDTDGDGVMDIPPIAELHLGVVSSDMGSPGIATLDLCAGLGDDGLLQHTTDMSMGCRADYPTFLTFRAGEPNPIEIASDFACMATLGTLGCGFEMQLESVLKALWPASDTSLTFLADVTGEGARGHGDVENAGFLRPSAGPDTSLLAVVLVTDEDDCSSATVSHLRPRQMLDPNVPADAALAMQGINVRCHHNPQNLHPVSRYVDGLRALRPNGQRLVVFGAITGVPPGLVEPSALAGIDFEDDTAREAFYARVLADEAMQSRIDARGTELDPDDDLLMPACSTQDGTAYPARRIVETARAFGRDSVIQSICQSDFAPAMDAILRAITRASKSACIVR